MVWKRLSRAFGGRREFPWSGPVITDLVVDIDGEDDTETCACCGRQSRVVWGLVHDHADFACAYFVHWTLGAVAEDGAHFDLVIGPWDDAHTEADRVCVSLWLSHRDDGPSFTVGDAAERPIGDGELGAHNLCREDVIDHDIAQQAYAIVDAIWLGDPRIAEVRGETYDET